MSDTCPKCGHAADSHNDAGSAPVGPIPGFDLPFIDPGTMCCYDKPNEGEKGVGTWGSRVCGCDYYPYGSRRHW